MNRGEWMLRVGNARHPCLFPELAVHEQIMLARMHCGRFALAEMFEIGMTSEQKSAKPPRSHGGHYVVGAPTMGRNMTQRFRRFCPKMEWVF
jgi:hypothetical protein